MKIDSAIRYTIKQFINDFISEYGLFTHRTMEKYFKRRGNPYIEEVYTTNYYLPFHIRYGATKVCLLFDDSKYVGIEGQTASVSNADLNNTVASQPVEPEQTTESSEVTEPVDETNNEQ